MEECRGRWDDGGDMAEGVGGDEDSGVAVTGALRPRGRGVRRLAATGGAAAAAPPQPKRLGVIICAGGAAAPIARISTARIRSTSSLSASFSSAAAAIQRACWLAGERLRSLAALEEPPAITPASELPRGRVRGCGRAISLKAAAGGVATGRCWHKR